MPIPRDSQKPWPRTILGTRYNSRFKRKCQFHVCFPPPPPPPPKVYSIKQYAYQTPMGVVPPGREIKGTETCCCAMVRLGTPLMAGRQGILFTVLTCKTFNRRCTQIHVLFQRVKTERGMCRACCEGIQTPNALVPLTNANSFHLHSTRATSSNI